MKQPWLLGAGGTLFASPIVLKLHDGIEAVEAEAQLTRFRENGLVVCQVYG